MATLVVHGGAGRLDPRIPRQEIDAGLERALDAGFAVIGEGALAAAMAAVRVLEDDVHFNAGRGAVLTAAGTVELDAGVMEHPGPTAWTFSAGGRIGAVGVISDTTNPVDVARAVLEDGRHLLIAGPGASRFAAERGLPLVDPGVLRAHARRALATSAGTVGAVCLDASGGTAVAVSTGGVAGKLPGRVGDSAICGAGFYAARAGAACATGRGEDWIRLAGSRLAVELMTSGSDAQTAALRVIAELEEQVGGQGGVITVDANGIPGAAHSTPAMPWAWRVEAPRRGGGIETRRARW
jgi:beta-aspartyl-peptidase (threonine type)